MTRHGVHDGITLRMLTIGDHYFPALNQFAREFEAETGARVELERARTWWHLHPAIAADVAASEPRYDLFCNDVEFQYTIRKHLLPLNPFLGARGDALADLFAPIVRYSLSPPDEPGTHYGIPLRARVPMAFYRTDLLGEFPASWEEYDRALEECGAPALHHDGGRFALGFAGGYNEQTTKLWLARYWSHGDPLLAPDGTPLIAGDRGVEALALLKRHAERFTPPGVHGWDHEYAGQMFREGRLAVLEGLAHPTLDGIEDPTLSAAAGRWSVGAYPGRGASVLTEPQLVIFRRTRHPEAAFDFIRYATGPASCRRLLADHGEFTARRSTWREAARGDAAGPAPAAQLDRIAGNLDRGIPFLPWVPQWLEMLRSLWDGVAACMGGRLEPRAALAAVAGAWTRAIEARPLPFPYAE